MIPKKHKPANFNSQKYTKIYGKFIKAWKWYNKSGTWMFCTARYEHKDGKKNIIPFSYNHGEWHPGQLLKENRPLMDLHKISMNKRKPILLVEGEKCYDIGKKFLSDHFIVTTWSSGTHAISKTDFSPLENRKVYYWFDHDDPGYNTIEFFKEKLNQLILVQPPINSPIGWDIADAVNIDKWDADGLFFFIMQYDKIESKPEKKKSENKNEKFIDNKTYPFEILGYNAGYMFFLPHETGQIFKIKKGSLNNQHLLELAPLGFWQDIYGKETKKGIYISWIDAQDDLIRECNKKNPFSYSNIRGRGAWKERNNIIIHTGKQLLFRDQIINVKDYSPNGHVYERLPELKLNIIKTDLNKNNLDKVVSCFRKLSIYNKLELNYLVGWCVLAPFCGALSWRPHIWLTGPAGSGKSAIVHMIIHKMLGEFIFCPEGDSSGAGIIQGLKNDSLPVVHDEIDRNTIGLANLEIELSITRSSSSASEKTRLYKGTADQTGKQYNYNSMFCFSSINVYLNKKSDKRRFSIINLSRNTKMDWKKFKKEIQETFTDNICGEIRSTIFYNWKIIKNNIKQFKMISGQYLNDQAAGDQIGTLIAGAATLRNLKEYNNNEIEKICENNLNSYIDNNECMTDEIECMLKIFTSKIKYINYNERTEDTTLLNLLNKAIGSFDKPPDNRAKNELYKYGIKYCEKEQKVYIATDYQWIKDILRNTPWQFFYDKILKRLSFIDKTTDVKYFGSYYTGRALGMKAEYIQRLSNDNIYMEAGF